MIRDKLIIGDLDCTFSKLEMCRMMSLLCLFLTCLRLFSTTSAIMTEKKALLIAADGSEEMEVVITADVLVRGGVKVGNINSLLYFGI